MPNHSRPGTRTRDSSTETDEAWLGEQEEESKAARDVERNQLLHSLALSKIKQDDAHDEEMRVLHAELGEHARRGEISRLRRCQSALSPHVSARGRRAGASGTCGTRRWMRHWHVAPKPASHDMRR